jgi:hypothetical protein
MFSGTLLNKSLGRLGITAVGKDKMITSISFTISYELEPYADALTPIIYCLKDWGVNHRKKVAGRYSKFIIQNSRIKVLNLPIKGSNFAT